MPLSHRRSDDRARVECGELDKTLRELSILRNTIYARYGWDGYRKPWLRAYFHSQPWFKPNPKFSYKLLTDADNKNAHFIAAREQGFTDVELREMRDDVYARHGKSLERQAQVEAQERQDGRRLQASPRAAKSDEDVDDSRDCRYAKKKWYTPNPPSRRRQTRRDDKMELGLIDRARWAASRSTTRARGKSESSASIASSRSTSCASSRCATCACCATPSTRAMGGRSSRRSCAITSAAWSWYKVDAAYTDKLLSRQRHPQHHAHQVGGERVRRPAQRRGLAHRAGHRRRLMRLSRPVGRPNLETARRAAAAAPDRRSSSAPPP